jgi:uncharacterized membrane protein
VSNSEDPDDPAPQGAGDTHERRTWRHALDESYRVSLVFKGIDGALELIGGLLLLAVSPTTMDRLARAVFQHELSEDPNDFVARHVLHLTANLHASHTFGAIYLLSHGVAKLVMVVGLWKRQRWAYPFALLFLIAFIVYQLYRMTFAPSMGLALLTIFDVLVTWLVWRDYREHRSRAGDVTARASRI